MAGAPRRWRTGSRTTASGCRPWSSSRSGSATAPRSAPCRPTSAPPTRTTSRGSRRSWRSRTSLRRAAPSWRPKLDAAVAAAKPGNGANHDWARADLDVNDDGMVDQRDLETLDAGGGAGADGRFRRACRELSGRSSAQRRAHGDLAGAEDPNSAAARRRAAARRLRRPHRRGPGALPGLDRPRRRPGRGPAAGDAGSRPRRRDAQLAQPGQWPSGDDHPDPHLPQRRADPSVATTGKSWCWATRPDAFTIRPVATTARGWRWL